jgi:heme/copper-type cytochrome/quinol oxidase subunit 2
LVRLGAFRIIKETAAVADVLAMAFMFILIIFGAVLMHAYSLRPLRAATDRQLELKCEHAYKTLETAWVEPYTISFLRAAAENLVLENPTVPGPHLRSAMENTFEYLSPPDYEISAALTYDETSLMFNENRKPPSKQFTQQGTLSIMKAGGENVVVHVVVMLFKIS